MAGIARALPMTEARRGRPARADHRSRARSPANWRDLARRVGAGARPPPSSRPTPTGSASTQRRARRCSTRAADTFFVALPRKARRVRRSRRRPTIYRAQRAVGTRRRPRRLPRHELRPGARRRRARSRIWARASAASTARPPLRRACRYRHEPARPRRRRSAALSPRTCRTPASRPVAGDEPPRLRRRPGPSA